MYSPSPGTFTNVKPQPLAIAEIDQVGCFPGTPIYGDIPEGKYPLDYVSNGTTVALLAKMADTHLIPRKGDDEPGGDGHSAEDEWLVNYADQREGAFAHTYFLHGLPGLSILQEAYGTEPHHKMAARIGERLTDPAFTRDKSPVTLAGLRALARDPDRYLPCLAVKNGA